MHIPLAAFRRLLLEVFVSVSRTMAFESTVWLALHWASGQFQVIMLVRNSIEAGVTKLVRSSIEAERKHTVADTAVTTFAALRLSSQCFSILDRCQI